MEKLKFVFNEERVKEAGRSIEDIMKPIREHLFSFGIEERSEGEFVMEGSDTESIFTTLILELTEKDYEFVNLLDSWILEDDFESEDVIKEIKDLYRSEGIIC